MTDPTITIAGLRAQIDSLIDSIGRANSQCASFCDAIDESRSVAARLTAERDALAAELAQVSAAAAAAALLHQQATTAYEGERADAARLRAELAAVRGALEAPADVTDLAAYASGVVGIAARSVGFHRAADERSAEVDRLTSELADARRGAAASAADALRARAELEARPVLTVERLAEAIEVSRSIPNDAARRIAADAMAKLGPVTLAAQDRAEALARELYYVCGLANTSLTAVVALDCGTNGEKHLADKIRAALTRLGAPPTSPPVARQVFAGVSLGDLEGVFFAAERACPATAAAIHLGCCRLAGIRAVLARLEVSLVAPVDLAAIERAVKAYHDAPGKHAMSADSLGTGQWKSAVLAMAAAFTAAGVPADAAEES